MDRWPSGEHLSDTERLAILALYRHWTSIKAEAAFFTEGTPERTALDALAEAAVKLACGIDEVARQRSGGRASRRRRSRTASPAA